VDVALLGAFAAVVLVFVTASWLGQSRAGDIERAALSIHGNAAPSIRRLASARAELRRLQLLVHRALADGSPRGSIAEIGAGRALMDAEISEYRRLPMYPGEAAVWQQAESGLARIDADFAAIGDAIQRGDLEEARRRQQRLDDSAEDLARTLSRAIDVNVMAASRLAAGIEDARRRGFDSTLMLDGAGVLLAGLAAALALRVSRAHARTVHAYRFMAERRADELEQFAARMAHDVRTPLAAASMSLEMVERYGGDDPRFRRASKRARRGIAQTVDITEALFEFARSGARPQPDARASLADAAEDVATVMQARADAIDAEIVLHATTRAAVPCAAGALESALGNLVGNALTYVEGAEQRRVTIEIADDGPEVKAVVSDSGPGLPPGVAAESLFDPYVRGEHARGTGLGLGLATVKRIVEAHGGRVGVRSSAAGCSFWFTLPRAPNG
jgi:signal transduction histidine kinase